MTGKKSDFTLSPADVAHVSALPVHYRDILGAFDTHGSYEAMADCLGLPLGTVKSRLNRARAKVIKLRAAAAKRAETA